MWNPLRRLIADRVADEAVRLVQSKGLDSAARVILSNSLGLTSEHPGQPIAQVDAVFTCVRVIREAVSSFDFGVMAGDDWIDHPLEELLDSPDDSAVNVFERTIQHLEGFGAAYWRLDRPSREIARTGPRSIELLPPWEVQPVRSRERGPAEAWRWRTERIERDDLIVFAYPNPYDPALGMAPLTAARMAYDLLWKGGASQQGFFDQGSVPPFFISLPEDVPLAEDEFERLKIKFREEYTGLRNTGKVPIMARGARLEPIAISQKDAEWLASMRMSREQVLGVFGVPPILAGVLEFANYSVAVEQKRLFWQGTIPPKLALLAKVVNKRLLPLFGPGRGDVEFKFDLAARLREVIPEDVREGILAAQNLVAMGVPPADAFELLGLPIDAAGKPWLAMGWLDANKVPATLALEPPPPPPPPMLPPPEEEPPEEPDEPEEETRTLKRKTPAGTALWRLHVRETAKLERQAIGAYGQFLDWVRDRVLARISAPKAVAKNVDEMLPPEDEMNAELLKRFRPIVRKSVETGFGALSAEISEDLLFNWLDVRVQAHVLARNQIIVGTNEPFRARLRDALSSALEEPHSEETLRRLVLEVFDGQRWNARTIARTETAAGFSFGRQVGMEDAGIERHEWLTAQDEAVRDSHKNAEDDGPVKVGQPFSNGLRYPHDPAGGPEEVINCRCVTVAVVD